MGQDSSRGSKQDDTVSALMGLVYIFEGEEKRYLINQNTSTLPKEFWIIINVVETVSRRETRAGVEGVHGDVR